MVCHELAKMTSIVWCERERGGGAPCGDDEIYVGMCNTRENGLKSRAQQRSRMGVKRWKYGVIAIVDLFVL